MYNGLRHAHCTIKLHLWWLEFHMPSNRKSESHNR